MKKGKAREHILTSTKRIIEKNGYSNTNVIEVAREAKVSVGTLYYHFPRGKIDLLIAIFKEIVANVMEEAERLGFSPDKEFSSIAEALKFHLGIIIKLHKKYRLTLAAWESEVLANLDYFIKLRDEKDLAGELKGEMDVFIELIKSIIKLFPDENLTIEGKGDQLNFILQAIIHKYAYDDSIFASDEHFIDLVSKIIIAILGD